MTLGPSVKVPTVPVPRFDPFLALARLEERLRLAEGRAASLERALTSSRRIGIAVGILMCRHQLTPDQAIASLKTYSQRHNVKVRELAEAVICNGTL